MRAKSRPMSVWGAGEEVAHAAHRLDEARFLGIGLELGADLRDVHVDGAVEGLRMPLERVEDLLAGQHAAGGPGEGGQELELVVGEDPPLARHRDLARGEVELELADPQPRGWMRGGRAPQESADAGEELPWIERLGEIVVGAHLEPHHLVHIFALGGEHDHGQGGAVGEGADPAAYLEAVHAGEHDVEEHDVWPALVEDGETPRAVARQGHVDLVLAQVFRHEGAEAGIVVDQQGGGAARHGSYRITPPPIQCVARVKKCKGGPARVLAQDGPAQYYLTGYKSMATVTLLRSRPRPHHVARHPARTRERILAAALREFSEKGFAGARVDRIARRARVVGRDGAGRRGGEPRLLVRLRLSRPRLGPSHGVGGPRARGARGERGCGASGRLPAGRG